MARLARPGRGPGGREPGPIPDVQAAQAGEAAPRRAAQPDEHALHQHDQPRAGAVLPRRRGARAPHPAAGPLERGGDGAAGEQPVSRASAATSRRTPRRRPCTRSGFNHFFKGKDDAGGGDQVFFQGHAAPGIYARAFLEGRLSEDQLDHFRREVERQGPELVPASPADAGLLGVPDRLDGPRPAVRRLPGAVQPLPGKPRDPRHERAARVGVPRRRRDGRARVDRRHLAGRARGPRQPHLRHQLQPAAPRRTGPRQRQGDPGARGPVPRRRLERDQGRVGPRVGRAAGARRRRRAGREDERDARRRVPEVLGVERRLRPRALLRRRTRACAGSSSTSRTTTSSSCAAAATTTARSTRRTRRRRSTAAHRR